MKHRRNEKRKKSLQYVTKFLFFGGALGLLVVAILRFTAVQEALVQEALVNIYYLYFGAIMILTSFNVHKVVDQYRFLNYYWGKSLFCLFLASISLSSQEENFVKWILSIYFFSCTLCLGALAYLDRPRDVYQSRIDDKIIRSTYRPEADEELWLDSEPIPFQSLFRAIADRDWCCCSRKSRDDIEVERQERVALKSAENNDVKGAYGVMKQPDDIDEQSQESQEEVIKKRSQKQKKKSKRMKEALDSSF